MRTILAVLRRCGKSRAAHAVVVVAAAVVVAIAGCGGSGHSGSGGSTVPLTLAHVEANLRKAGYKITVYAASEGVLEIDATHKADGGFSIDSSPSGQQLYAAVYATSDAAVRAAVVSHNSDQTAPIVRGDLIFTISGAAPELMTIVKDAGDAVT